MNSKPLAITMGDPAGIGPEIIAKLFRNHDAAGAIVIGDVAAMERAAAKLGGGLAIQLITQPDAVVPAKTMPVLQTGAVPVDLRMGEISREAGQAAYDCIIKAIELSQAGAVSGIVTAPIHKEALKMAGISQPGHTEILAERTGTRHFGMMLANDELRVMLVSIHVPLVEAIRLVTFDAVLETIRLADKGTRAFGVERPRIAVAGLNPHAGENGLFGREDIDIIAPAVAAARDEGLDASGPFAPDTVFMRAREGAFDCVVAQYHDQGLIPVKYLGVDNGVNVTVGLPFVRTSVDHGTAFDIAGQGRADPSSLVYALRVAERMTTQR
ncbi:MAG: 4-hydroxythreonine-4-phosphate dehydrogenase PdxA [Beijerinckiaceae bacterium]|nr:4-hydroxythreonine-4-phosphate dehydrogenase PdxA [Beijerinckiaceae bacterium]